MRNLAYHIFLISLSMMIGMILAIVLGEMEESGHPAAFPLINQPEVANTSPKTATIDQSIAYVQSVDCDGASMTGTAWIAGKNLLVTSAHVITGTHDITVSYGYKGNQDKSAVRVVGYDDKNDLALLAVDTKGRVPLVMVPDSSEFKQGLKVTSYGHPRSRPLEASPLTAIEVYSHETRTVIEAYQGTVEPGDSGSPVFNEAGKVRGVVYGTSNDYSEAWVTPIEMVHKIIQEGNTNGWKTVQNGNCGDKIPV